MDIIYSRPRIKLKQNNNNKNRKFTEKKEKIIKKILKIIVILTIAFSILINSINSIRPYIKNICIEEAKEVAVTISSNKTSLVMKNYTYDDLVNIIKDDTGKITMIKINTIPINDIMLEISQKIQDEFNKGGKDKLFISTGSFTNLKLLTGRGPKISMRIETKGNVKIDYKSEFLDAGINQTIHRIYLNISSNMMIFTPFDDIATEVVNQVVLAENIIVGEIPSSYYNFNGVGADSAIDIIE